MLLCSLNVQVEVRMISDNLLTIKFSKTKNGYLKKKYLLLISCLFKQNFALLYSYEILSVFSVIFLLLYVAISHM